MDDKDFKKMDEMMMKKMEPLREQKVSDGMLRGFSASVERRLASPAEASERKPAGRLIWVPTLAVMLLASVAVLRSPVHEIQLAQAVVPADELQDDIAVLSELGVLDEYEDNELLAEEDALLDGSMELTQNQSLYSTLA